MQEEVKEKEVLYKDILKEREEMLERISGYDKEMYRLESQRENRKGKKKELLDYMWENYEITYHQAKQRIDLDETQSLTKVKETISELKNKIKNLGQLISMQSKIIKKFPNVTNLCRNSMKIS